MELDNISGSRDSDGNVPIANWYNGKFKVNWCNSQNANSNIRARAEVSHRASLIRGFVFSIMDNLWFPGDSIGNQGGEMRFYGWVS